MRGLQIGLRVLRQSAKTGFFIKGNWAKQKSFWGYFCRQIPRFFMGYIFPFCPTQPGYSWGIIQFIRQIVDFCFCPCYPVSQIRSLHLHKASIRFYLPPRSHTEPFCRHSSTTKSFGPCEADFLFFDRFAAGQPVRNSLTRTLKTASVVRIGYCAMTPQSCGRA